MKPTKFNATEYATAKEARRRINTQPLPDASIPALRTRVLELEKILRVFP